MQTGSSDATPRAAPRTDLDWLVGHLDALYRFDEAGRIIARADPRGGEPPRFHLARTRLGTIWRLSAALPQPVLRELVRLAALEPGVTLDASDPPPPPDRLEPLRRILETDRPIDAAWNGPAFALVTEGASRADLERIGRDAETVHAAADPRLERWADELGEPVEGLAAALPLAVSCFEGRVVSSCRVARGRADGFAEAGVETRASARGRGHAPRCVAAWALAISHAGGRPLYSTQWSNRASRRVAAKLRAAIFAEDWHFR